MSRCAACDKVLSVPEMLTQRRTSHHDLCFNCRGIVNDPVMVDSQEKRKVFEFKSDIDWASYFRVTQL